MHRIQAYLSQFMQAVFKGDNLKEEHKTYRLAGLTSMQLLAKDIPE